MEAHFHTERGAPAAPGRPAGRGARRRCATPSKSPMGCRCSPSTIRDAEVKGLDAVPRDEWPPVDGRPPRLRGDGGRGHGDGGAGGAHRGCCRWRRRGLPAGRWLLRAWVAAGPLGLVALEAGWLVTELGRQPWIVHGAMRTPRRGDALPPRLPRLSGSSRVSTSSSGVDGGLPAPTRSSVATTRRRRRRPPMGTELSLGGVMVAALVLYVAHGRRGLRGRRLGSARGRPAARGAAGAHRAGHRPDLGGEPRLAHPRGRAALQRLPARPSRPSPSALHIPLTLFLVGVVLPRLGLHLPRLRRARRRGAAALGPRLLAGQRGLAAAAGDGGGRARLGPRPRRGRRGRRAASSPGSRPSRSWWASSRWRSSRYLAAIYLANEARTPPSSRDDFRRRALGAGAAVGALALVTFPPRSAARRCIRAGLTERPWTWPLHAGHRRRPRSRPSGRCGRGASPLARLAAIGAGGAHPARLGGVPVPVPGGAGLDAPGHRRQPAHAAGCCCGRSPPAPPCCCRASMCSSRCSRAAARRSAAAATGHRDARVPAQYTCTSVSTPRARLASAPTPKLSERHGWSALRYAKV